MIPRPWPLPAPSFVRHVDEATGAESVTIESPWYREILIWGELIAVLPLAALPPDGYAAVLLPDADPRRIRFQVANGWAVYEFVEEDFACDQSRWRCVEFWGGEVEEDLSPPAVTHPRQLPPYSRSALLTEETGSR